MSWWRRQPKPRKMLLSDIFPPRAVTLVDRDWKVVTKLVVSADFTYSIGHSILLPVYDRETLGWPVNSTSPTHYHPPSFRTRRFLVDGMTWSTGVMLEDTWWMQK